MRLTIPDYCLVTLLGRRGDDVGDAKSRWFAPSEISGLEACRLVTGLEGSGEVAEDVEQLFHTVVGLRLKHRRLTLVDGHDLGRQQRAALVATARRHYARPIALLLQERGAPGAYAHLHDEGFREVLTIPASQPLAEVDVVRKPLPCDARHERGPYDIIGDIHGCGDELEELLAKLGYRIAWGYNGDERTVRVEAPAGRRVIFLGDLVDRGPRTPDVMRIVMAMVAAGHALCILGNHDVKLLRWLEGRKVKIAHGNGETIAQMELESPRFRQSVATFLEALPSQLWLDGGQLVVAHAGIRQEMVGRHTGAVREFCLYGETKEGDDPEDPVARDGWIHDYRGPVYVAYGHVPRPEAVWVGRTIGLDTACVFGGRLTALKWPEREIVHVVARTRHATQIS